MKLNAPILVDSIIYSDFVSILGTIKVTWTILQAAGPMMQFVKCPVREMTHLK